MLSTVSEIKQKRKSVSIAGINLGAVVDGLHCRFVQSLITDNTWRNARLILPNVSSKDETITPLPQAINPRGLDCLACISRHHHMRHRLGRYVSAAHGKRYLLSATSASASARLFILVTSTSTSNKTRQRQTSQCLPSLPLSTKWKIYPNESFCRANAC